jgi:UDP-N-acetylmuramate--alanine ligase
MSAIASVLLSMGHQVSGSDQSDSRALRRLENLGAVVRVGHDPSNIEGADIVARSTAVATDNVEVVAAGRAGIEVWRRSELLAAVCDLRRTAAVSGTHGKTTTSSMLFVVLREAGMHPSAIIGGDVAGLGSGAAWDPAGQWMVVEADESDGTFLRLGAEIAVVTSVEPDHLDYFGNERSLRSAFADFVVGASGPVVLCADDPGAAALAGPRRSVAGAAPVVTYGVSGEAEVRISRVELGRSTASFDLSAPAEPTRPVSIAVPGLHNVRNAAAAVAAAHSLGVTWDSATRAIGAFRGVGRRMEVRGELHGATFVDDYGHLPTEVSAAISAARDGGWSRVVAVFQPHRYTRTRDQWQRFADAFAGADLLVITDIYPAGESPLTGVSGRLVYEAVRSAHPGAKVRYVPSLDEVADLLPGVLRSGDVCLTLGAGDVTTLPDMVGASSPVAKDDQR